MVNLSKLQRKAAAFLATSALLLSSFAPAAFAAGTTNLTISGNGADTNNTVNSNVTDTNTVVQNNTATVTNSVTVSGNTGSNTADKNTGGDVSIQTGDATARVSIGTTANLNRVVAPDCNCGDSTLNATIKGNGADSTNHINTNDTHTNSVFQNNDATVTNAVTTDLTTGNNTASKNTGGLGGTGDVSIMTGNAGASVTIANRANANLAQLGGTGTGGSVTNLTIEGNGADSNSSIGLNHTRAISLVQDNTADFVNAVTTDADTGHNKANENTGDNVFVGTGDTAAIVTVDNLANFNAASADCGCLLTDNKTLSGNGADSVNHINQNMTETLSLFQGGEKGTGNLADFVNALTVDPSTGHNNTNENTNGGVDPVAIMTGDSGSAVTLHNNANANLFGTMTLPGGTDLGLSFDLAGLMGF